MMGADLAKSQPRPKPADNRRDDAQNGRVENSEYNLAICY